MNLNKHGYWELLGLRDEVNAQLKKKRREEHLHLFEQHSSLFHVLDVLFVLCILMNFGALVITNSIVVKDDIEAAQAQGEELKFYEVNPTTSSSYGYVQHPEPSVILDTLIVILKYSIIWTFLIGVYVYYRTTIFSHKAMYIFAFFVGYYFSMLGYDFFHDLGYLLAVWWT